jgi:hypothetical protein
MRTTRYAVHVQAAQRKTHRNWYQMKKGKPARVGSTFAKLPTHRRATTGIASNAAATVSSALLAEELAPSFSK